MKKRTGSVDLYSPPSPQRQGIPVVEYEIRLMMKISGFHVLQAAPFTNAASGPTEAGYFCVMLANVNPAEKETWQKSENQVAGGRCLHVSSVSRDEVREGSCMVGGVRLSSRVFKLVNTSVADEYGIRSVWNTCWQPEAKAGADDAEAAAD